MELGKLISNKLNLEIIQCEVDNHKRVHTTFYDMKISVSILSHVLIQLATELEVFQIPGSITLNSILTANLKPSLRI